MTTIYDKDNDQLIAELSQAQFQFLQDQLEEESSEDVDYAITEMTLAYFEELGADAELVALLRKALAGRDVLTISW
jgi:hypothetical protein